MKDKINLTLLILIFYLSGCATLSGPSTYPPGAEGLEGIYHRMVRGQTLWRVSKIYNVELNELIRINKIPDVRDIKTGQLIFIPRAQKIKPSASTLALESFEEFTWPVKGKVITYFGQKKNNIVNKGLNIAIASGADITASRSGVISFYSPNFRSLGKTIIIDHQDGFISLYSKLSDVLVTPGEKVSRGKRIGKIISGRRQDNYLHFEIRKGHLAQNPLFYLP